MHIFVFFLPLIFFVYCLLLGYPFLRLLITTPPTQIDYSDAIFAAPVFGFIILILSAFTLNFSFHLPVSRFAAPLNIMLSGVAIALMWLRKDFPPLWQFKKYFFLVLLALALTAYPLMLYGFGWISFANDDMMNYNLGALRFFEHAFTAPVDMQSLLAVKDFSYFYWFVHVGGFTRAGSELLLALFYGVCHIDPQNMFMILIVLSHLLLVFVSPLLINANASQAQAKRFLLMLMMVVAANVTLGVTYQLIAQVGALALGILFITFAFQWIDRCVYHGNPWIRKALFLTLSLAALFIYYPELTPFMGLPIVLYLIVSGVKKHKKMAWQALVGGSLLFIILFAIILNRYAIFTYHSLILQLTGGSSAKNADLFPYFFVPSGLPAIWGMSPVEGVQGRLYSTVLILIGAFMTLWIFVRAIKLVCQKDVSGYVVLIAYVVGAGFFLTKSGFGLFKLVMYVQPYIWSVFVQSIFMMDYVFMSVIFFVGVVYLQLHVQAHYMLSSKGDQAGGYAQLFQASQLQLRAQCKMIADQLKATNTTAVFLDTNNLPLLKLQFYYLRGIMAFDLSRNVLRSEHLIEKLKHYYFLDDVYHEFAEAIPQIDYNYQKNVFIFSDRGSLKKDIFFTNKLAQAQNRSDMTYIFSGPNFNIFNRAQFSSHELFHVLHSEEAKNYLIFINAALGQDYYFGEPMENIALNQLQMDQFFQGKTYAGIGNYLLVRLVNPTADANFLMALTSSPNPKNATQLPKICVIGRDELCYQSVGSGSERVAMALPHPRIIDGVPYLLIVIPENTSKFISERPWLLGWYGNDIDLDYRHITTFARDFSLVDRDDFKSVSGIQHFPGDLANPNLLYGGFYEDGWVNQRAWVELYNDGRQELSVVMHNAITSHTNYVHISLDGKIVGSKRLKVGKNEWHISTHEISDGPHQINLSFSAAEKISAADVRMVSAKIERIEFR